MIIGVRHLLAMSYKKQTNYTRTLNIMFIKTRNKFEWYRTIVTKCGLNIFHFIRLFFNNIVSGTLNKTRKLNVLDLEQLLLVCH